MITVELAFFGLCSLLVLLGGIITVAARNPIRGAMGLLTTIVGIAGMYLLLTAEFLAAIQIIVYAGAVVVLFLFVIMLLGPAATSPADAKSAIPRYLGAGVFLLSAGVAATAIFGGRPPATFAPAPAGLGTIESIGRELFTTALIPFEISGALLIVAIVGAIAVARGKQIDPTAVPQKARALEKPAAADAEAASAPAVKEAHSG